MKNLSILPLFIVHEGCPCRCVFCDQKSITQAPPFSLEAAKEQLEEQLRASSSPQRQIAFFGGSFTALPRERMKALLDLAQGYVEKGLAHSIRFSTRPDAMGPEILSLLSSYAVTDVELGIQSMSDKVLKACQRGHDSACAEQAALRILNAGLRLTGQMMLGLPFSTPEDEEETARRICRMGASFARVYPTVVFSHTPLADMAQRGQYHPLSSQDAIRRGARVCRIFLQNKVSLLRVGLCDNALLHSDRVLGGANLPAYGEQIYAALWREAMEKEFLPQQEALSSQALRLYVPPSQCSQVCGHQKENKQHLLCRFSLSAVQIYPLATQAPYTLSYEFGDKHHRKKGFLDVLKNT